MADAKSVIDIEVNDDSFKAFVAAFGTFQKALSDAKSKTDQLGQGLGNAGNQNKKAFSDGSKAIRDFTNSARDALEVIKKMSSFAFDIAKSFANAALSAAKWLTFGAIASGFGLGELAGSAARTRRESLELGVTPGQFKSAEIFYKQIYGDGAAQLNKIANALQNPVERRVFNRLGIDPEGKDPFQLLIETTNALAREARANPKITKQEFESSGLGVLSDLNTFRLLSNLPQGRAEQIGIQAGQGAKTLQVDQGTLDRWNKFNIALDKAGVQVENSLIKGLSGLTGPLSDLSSSIANAITQILESPEFKQAIANLGKEIEKFARYLSTPEFRETIQELLVEFGKLSDFISDMIDYLGQFFANTPAKLAEEKAKIESYGRGTLLNLSGAQRDILAREKRIDDTTINPTIQSLYRTDENKAKNFAASLDILRKLPPGTIEALQFAAKKGGFARYGISAEQAKSVGVTDPTSVTQMVRAEAILLQRSYEKYGDVTKAIADVLEGSKGKSLESELKQTYIDRQLATGLRRTSAEYPELNINVNVVAPSGSDANVNAVKGQATGTR